MVVSDLDSFYFKFKNLLYSEKDATLTVKAEAGRVQVSLSADLGHVLSVDPSLYHHEHPHCRNGPSQQRRRARRAEARASKLVSQFDAAEKVVTESSAIDKSVEVVEEAMHTPINVSEEENEVRSVEKTDQDFQCDLCDFKSKWANGVRIHMGRKHSVIKQLDGNFEDCEESGQN